MEFNESNIECSYIQNLLYNFYVPTISIADSVDSYNSQDDEHFITRDGGLYVQKNGKKKFVSTYFPGKNYNGLTRNIISESNNYNTNLHEQLGNYLRFIRDYYKVDLMPLYNCFSNRFIDTFSLPIDDERKQGSPVKAGMKLFAFPVAFGHRYSIFCKNNCEALMQLAFFNGKKPLTISFKRGDDSKDYIIFKPFYSQVAQWEENVISIPERSKQAEILADGSVYKDLIDKTLRINDINLYLFVQIPDKNAENIVVIEDNSSKVINNSLINNHVQKPFSDKLLGYLLNYYISPLDPIQQNIEKYQSILASDKYNVQNSQGYQICVDGQPYTGDDSSQQLLPSMTLTDYTPGVFDFATRDFIYNLYRFAGIDDFTGYIDKDVENYIIKGKIDNRG